MPEEEKFAEINQRLDEKLEQHFPPDLFKTNQLLRILEQGKSIQDGNIKTAENKNIFDNRSVKGEGTRKRQIAQGHYGIIYETDFVIDGHRTTFAEKSFKDNEYGTAEENAKSSFNKYLVACAAKLRVFPIYCLSEDKKSILMTPYFGDWGCVSANNRPTLEDLGLEQMKSIDNFQALLENLFTEAIKAAQSKIRIVSDLFLFLVNKENPSFLDFISGDFDQISTNFDEYEEEEIFTIALAYNLENVIISLQLFLESNVKNYQSYIAELRNYYRKIAKQYGNIF